MQSSPYAVSDRPSLGALFGVLSASDEKELMDQILHAQELIHQLVSSTAEQIGASFAYPEIKLFVREKDALLSSAPFSELCGFQFEIGFVMGEEWYAPEKPPPWLVESSVYVLCDRQPPHTDHCIHDLIFLGDRAYSSKEAIAMFQRQISEIGRQVGARPVEDLIAARHDALPLS